MRTFFGYLFEKIRGHVPRYPAIALGLASAPASEVPVESAGKGAPTEITHPVTTWPIGSRWWRTDGAGTSEALYIQTAGGWYAVPLGGEYAEAIQVDEIQEATSSAGVTVDGCLIKDGAAAKLATAAFYQSASAVTATGSSQAVAHGLAATPRKYWVEILSGHNGSGAAGTQVPTVAWGTVNDTNLTVTVSAGATFKLHAIL